MVANHPYRPHESQDESPRAPDPGITVLLVDDHAVVRAGYRRLLERDPGIEVIGEASNPTEALRLARELTPDVIVLDIALPGASGIDTLGKLLKRRPRARVLMFSMYEDGIYASRSLDAGALGYLSKSSAPEMLVDGVRAVAQGRRYVSPDVARNMRALSPGIAILARSLTPRERTLLQLLSAGEDTQDIGTKLGVSAKTIANIKSSLKQKLGTDTTLQLIRMARHFGLD